MPKSSLWLRVRGITRHVGLRSLWFQHHQVSRNLRVLRSSPPNVREEYAKAYLKAESSAIKEVVYSSRSPDLLGRCYPFFGRCRYCGQSSTSPHLDSSNPLQPAYNYPHCPHQEIWFASRQAVLERNLYIRQLPYMLLAKVEDHLSLLHH
jgi:hypothetical protein